MDGIIRDISNNLNIWKSRNLSIIGKIQIIKWFGMSKLLYVGSVISIPHSYIKNIERLFYHFIWNGQDKIKRAAMINDHCDGEVEDDSLEKLYGI